MALDSPKIPRHVAIIMDGNGRWASQRGLPRVAGHRAGMETLREVVRASSDMGVQVLTVYAFSTENWKRPQEEISGIYKLLLEYLGREVRELVRQNVRIRIMGQRERLSDAVLQAIDKAHRESEHCGGLVFNVALNYGGRQEIVDAVRHLCQKARDGVLLPEGINENTLSDALYTAGLPDPDLLIRTGGDMRLSNFLLYQSSYSELYIAPMFWPDFNREAYLSALEEYGRRQRRFGAAPVQG